MAELVLCPVVQHQSRTSRPRVLERFQTRPIEGEESLERRHDYVLANPVRAGLCASIEDWPWSFSRYAPRLRRF